MSSDVFAEYEKDRSVGVYDFYRCFKCGWVFSHEHELRSMSTGKMCPCGSSKYSPTMPNGLEWVYPRIIKYTLRLVLARGIAPFARQHAQWLLPIIGKLVKIT